jgi:hypothetical protein
MAVVITTKFYAASEWKNLAKVVFTSPNMDSPSSAGTRSHILPGESDLGLWYEDTTSMYRIEDSQVPYTSTYFGYSATINEDIDLDDPPLTVGVDTANQSDWIEFIRSEVDIASASYPVSYSTVSGGGVTMYASSGTAANALNGTGWQVSATSENHWLEFSFNSSVRPSKFAMESVSGYEGKYFKIQGYYDPTNAGSSIGASAISWTDLYDGTSQDNALEYSTSTQTFTFSNYTPYTHIRILFMGKWAASSGYSAANCVLSKYAIDESVTNTKSIYVGSEQILSVTNAQLGTSDDTLFTFDIDSTTGSGTVASGTTVAAWGWPDGWGAGTSLPDVSTQDSVVFEVTTGEAYDCRLTAWDDVTHSTTTNTIISSDRCRVSCLAFNSNGTAIEPTENEGVSYIHPPALNRVFKGNVTNGDDKYYYGDFDMIYRTGSVLGDYLMFKPMLYI